MDMSKTFTISFSYEIDSDNEFWRELMDKGIEAAEVTGGYITTPQNTKRKSEAAVIGGIFLGSREAAGMAEENSRKIIDSIIPSELGDRMTELIKNQSAVIADIEMFATNIAKSEYQKIAAEFSDNEEEKQATEEVINSMQVRITISGIPTEDEIYDWVNVKATELIENIIKGGNVQ